MELRRLFLALVVSVATFVSLVQSADASAPNYTLTGPATLRLAHGHRGTTTYLARNADGSVVSNCENTGFSGCAAMYAIGTTNPPTGYVALQSVNADGTIDMVAQTTGWTTGTWYVAVIFPVDVSTARPLDGATTFLTTITVRE